MNWKLFDTPYSLGILLQLLGVVAIFQAWGRFSEFRLPGVGISVGLLTWVLLRFFAAAVWSQRKSRFPDVLARLYAWLYLVIVSVFIVSVFRGLGASGIERDQVAVAVVLLLIPTAVVEIQND